MKTYRKVGGLVLGAFALLVMLTPTTVSAAATDGSNGGAQAGKGPGAIGGPENPAPDSCLHIRQLNPDEQKYRTVSNIPFTYTSGVYGANWFDVACGDLSFSVPAGQQALVDLTAVAELDCQGPAGSTAGAAEGSSSTACRCPGRTTPDGPTRTPGTPPTAVPSTGRPTPSHRSTW